MGWLGDGSQGRFAMPERRWDCRRSTPLEVAADWHELVVPRRILQPSIARDSGQFYPRCSTTDIPPPQSAVGLHRVAHYSLTDPGGMACWVGVGRPTQQPRVGFEPSTSGTVPRGHQYFVDPIVLTVQGAVPSVVLVTDTTTNALNINSFHLPTKFSQPANLTTYTIWSLFSLQVEPASHLLSP